MDINEFNHRFYEQSDTVDSYTAYRSLFPEEEAIFRKYESFFRDRTILDLGCGGGRTTGPLLRLTSHYTGLDYSAAMIEACRKRFSGTDFLHADASDLNPFMTGQFDCVWFSFNGLDCLSHSKRLRCLSEISRVLKPGGLFVFSSHNRDLKNKVVAYDPRSLNIFQNVRNIRSYRRVKNYQVHAQSYEILSDPLAGFGHLTYYITVSDQTEQLCNAGFSLREVFNRKAKSLKSTDRDRKSNFLYYVCIKSELQPCTSPTSQHPA